MLTPPDKTAIDNVIANVCIRVIREPLLCFSEADLQQMLVEGLKTIESLRKSVPTAVARGLDSKGEYHTCLVHREYGGGEGRRVDVVIFDPEDAARIDSPNLTAGGKYLTPLYAIELGTEKSADTASHLRNDLARLKGAKATGYIVHIFRDTTLTARGQARRELTEEKIEQTFKAAFRPDQVTIPANVRVLAILLRTGRLQARMTGKCETLDQQSGHWVKVNVGREEALRAAILKQLE